MEELTPRQIVAELDKYIIGQDDAKRSVAVALRNRWRRARVDESIREEIQPANILMIGPTGVGKTEVAKRLARLARSPFVKVEATKFTEVGYVGRDVDSMVRDLVDTAVAMEKERSFLEVEGRARERAEERLLDLLIPAPERRQGADDPETEERHRRTREKLRAKLANGSLDAREVTIHVEDRTRPLFEVFSNAGIEEMGLRLPEGIEGVLPKRRKGRSVTVAEARAILVAEEKERLVDMEAVVSRAIRAAEETGIIFVDEIDKIASRGSAHGPDVSREGVQRDILPIVEGSSVATKHGPVRTGHVLFIAAGAFHMTKPADLIPELQGRFPIRVEFKALTAGDFERILLEPRNALIKQYTALIEAEGCSVTFTRDAVSEIARTAFRVNEKMENIGARRLQTVLAILLEEYLYELPNDSMKRISITGAVVRKALDRVVADDDLARYIL
jgi:ATP-dependent HslUV protease ATP-binding subunit HslU